MQGRWHFSEQDFNHSLPRCSCCLLLVTFGGGKGEDEVVGNVADCCFLACVLRMKFEDAFHAHHNPLVDRSLAVSSSYTGLEISNLVVNCSLNRVIYFSYMAVV